MNLCVSHFLIAGLFLSISALTPEECQPLITPLNLTDFSVLYGKFHSIMGYADTENQPWIGAILKATDSSWLKVSPIPDSTNEVLMVEENKINGNCFGHTVNVTIDGDTVNVPLGNLTSVFKVLPSCDGCLVIQSVTTVWKSDMMEFFEAANITASINEEKVTASDVYLMGKETTLKDSDLEQFKQQASCLGYSKEPDYQYDPKKDFCIEGEGIHVKL